MREYLGKYLLSSGMASNILLGLGVLWAGQMIVPLIKGAVRPVAVKGAQGAIAISEQTSGVLEKAREELSRIIEDAKQKRQMPIAYAGMEGMSLRDKSSEQEINDLKLKIAALTNQLAEVRNGRSINNAAEAKPLLSKENKSESK